MSKASSPVSLCRDILELPAFTTPVHEYLTLFATIFATIFY